MRSPFFVSMPSCAIHLIDVCHCGSRGTANSSPRAARNSPVMTTSLANVPRRTRSVFASESARYPEKHPDAITTTAHEKKAFTFMRFDVLDGQQLRRLDPETRPTTANFVRKQTAPLRQRRDLLRIRHGAISGLIESNH